MNRADARRSSATGAVVARVAAAILQLVSLAAVARLLGADALGTAVTYFAVTRLAGTICSSGLPYWLLRELPRLSDGVKQREVVARAVLVTGGVTVAVGVIVGTGVWLGGARAGHAVLLGVVGSTIAAVGRVVSGALRGMGDGTFSLLAEFAGPPVVTLAGTMALAALTNERSRGLLLVVLVLASGVPTVLMLHRVGLVSPAYWGRGRAPLPTRHDWVSYATSGVLGVALVDVPPLVASATLGVASAGALGAAQRVLSLPTLVIVGLSATFSPHFSRAWHNRDGRELRRQFRASQVAIAAPLIPLLLVVIAAPRLALLPFGGAVGGTASDVVRVLAAGQLVNAATGLAPDLLLMSAHARSEVRWTALAVTATLMTCAVTALVGGGLISYSLAIGLGMGLRNIGCYVNAREVMHHVEATALHQ